MNKRVAWYVRRPAREILRQWLQLSGDTMRLMVGVGSYAAYCDHMRRCQPLQQPMTEQAYFRHCQQSRYPSSGHGGIKRCPC